MTETAAAGCQVPADGTYPTTCWECSTCCGALATVRAGRVVDFAPNRDHPYSKGAFCIKGIRGAPGITYHPNRLLYPQRRAGARGEGKWARISWDEALDEMADRLAQVRQTYGPEAIVGATSGAFFSRSVILALTLRSIGSPTRTLPRRKTDSSQFLERFLHDLPRGVPRQLRHYLERSRHLVARQPRQTDSSQLRLHDLVSGDSHDEGKRDLATRWIGNANHRCFLHEWMPFENLLDLSGVNVHSPADQHVLAAPHDEQVPVLVHSHQVTGMQPTILQGARGLLRAPVIPLHDARSAHQQFPRVPLRHGPPLHVGQQDPQPGQRQSDRARFAQADRRIDRHHRRSLGQPVSFA